MPPRKFTPAPMLQPRFNGRADNLQWPVSSDHSVSIIINLHVVRRTITSGVSGV